MTDAEYFEMNRAGWDQRVKAHVESRFYDVDGFLAGATSLREIERAELADVRGKKLLHLQCHFGLDTLSWARRGAICTGVDISPAAIGQARDLAQRAQVDAEFVCSDVYGFVAGSAGPYDIVFTSYGAICWLPDLDKWAAVVASNLAPGGLFYMMLLVEEYGVEYPENEQGHPILPVFKMMEMPEHIKDEIKHHLIPGQADLDSGPIFSIY